MDCLLLAKTLALCSVTICFNVCRCCLCEREVMICVAEIQQDDVYPGEESNDCQLPSQVSRVKLTGNGLGHVLVTSWQCCDYEDRT